MSSRVLLLWLAGALGAALGAWGGGVLGHPLRGAALGAALALALVVIADSLRGQALARWLAAPNERKPPQGSGYWGELSYRVQKALGRQARETAVAERRLAQFFEAIEASPNGVLLLDTDDQIDWCNRAAADHFGIDPERDIGQPVTNLVRAPAFVAFLQARRFEEVLVFEDTRGPGALSLKIRPYGEGMTLVISEDVTERTRNEAMRRDFVANVSHEIRTPLTVLAGFVETLQTLKLSAQEQARIVELMAQQTQRMQALVSDLLTLARLEGSPRPPPDRWVPVASLLSRVQAEAEGLSKGRHRITVAPDDVDAMIAGNEQELFSALSNLVSNAVRYTAEGGQVDVRWSLQADGVALLSVRDDGIGIAPEHLSKLAQRFYRVDGSRSRDTGGTGLGLSIVKHVARRHGGELLIESTVGQGSRFTVQLPAGRVRRGEALAA